MNLYSFKLGREEHPVQQPPLADTTSPNSKNVFSNKRTVKQPSFPAPNGLEINKKQKMDGLTLLSKLATKSIPLVFFDPQYRSILDKQNYGNEGKTRGRLRAELPQMPDSKILDFISEIERILIPSGHLMLWVDKYMLCTGLESMYKNTALKIVDLITWNKERMGMGYRTRRFCEYLVIFQIPPKRAKGVWHVHDIPDVWSEKIENGNKNHTHAKPVALQKRLIEAVTNPGDIIVDPAAGGYSVMYAANSVNRQFIGCDIKG